VRGHPMGHPFGGTLLGLFGVIVCSSSTNSRPFVIVEKTSETNQRCPEKMICAYD